MRRPRRCGTWTQRSVWATAPRRTRQRRRRRRRSCACMHFASSLAGARLPKRRRRRSWRLARGPRTLRTMTAAVAARGCLAGSSSTRSVARPRGYGNAWRRQNGCGSWRVAGQGREAHRRPRRSLTTACSRTCTSTLRPACASARSGRHQERSAAYRAVASRVARSLTRGSCTWRRAPAAPRERGATVPCSASWAKNSPRPADASTTSAVSARSALQAATAPSPAWT